VRLQEAAFGKKNSLTRRKRKAIYAQKAAILQYNANKVLQNKNVHNNIEEVKEG
jgi:hypothetical protein